MHFKKLIHITKCPYLTDEKKWSKVRDNPNPRDNENESCFCNQSQNTKLISKQ